MDMFDQKELKGHVNSFEGNEWKLDSNLELLESVDTEIERRLAEAGWDEDSRNDVRAGLSDAVTNAIVHGNLKVSKIDNEMPGLFRDRAQNAFLAQTEPKYVYVSVSITGEEIRISIRDEGDGFDWRNPSQATGDNLMKTSGRSLTMMTIFFDQVLHNEKGNEITLIKHR